MSDDLDAILRRVASGELSPEEAAGLIPAARVKPATSDLPPVGSAGETINCIRLTTSYRSIQIYADPAVARIHVSGTHSIEQQGSTLVVSRGGPFDDNDRGQGEPGPFGGKFSFSNLPRTIAWARSWREHQLTVRVNPQLAIELDLTGADIKAVGLESGLKARLVASSLKADKCYGTWDIEANSSSVKLSGVPTGRSRLYFESSSARLSLLRGTDVTISGTNRMGRLVLPDGPTSTLPFEGETHEVKVGEGQHRLSVESVMSSVSVGTQVWDEVPR